MNKTLIVSLEPEIYRQLEKSAGDAGVTVPRHASELLTDLLAPVTVKSKPVPPPAPPLPIPKGAGREFFLQAILDEVAPTPKPAPKRTAAVKGRSAANPKTHGNALRGLAAFSPARRSEIALKAAATRKRKAEEAERTRR